MGWRLALVILAAASLLDCSIGVLAGGAVVGDVLQPGLRGVTTLYQGSVYENFERPLPEVVETTIFKEFEGLFNQTQEFHADGHNTYIAEGRQFVVSIASGRVSGILGNVFDANGREFSQFVPSGSAPVLDSQLTAVPCKKYKRLATAVQKYGHMYYHFIQEVLPRIILLLPYLDHDTKLLTFGSPHEYKWLAELGISAEQIEQYDPAVQYCADELLVPTMSPVVTPPKENYELLRTTFHATPSLPASERDLLIYCSRRHAADRQVANEAAVLAAIQAQFPAVQLHVYTGEESVAETVSLFRRAKVVLGIHGAGLSHSIFSALDAVVVELLFMSDPPLMFWHATSALTQRYVMVPLPQTWWLDQVVSVPVQDVLDALAIALDSDGGQCDPGFFMYEATGACLPCPAGTYRPAGPASCLPCPAGKFASKQGAAFCATCPVGTFSDAGFECSSCPAASTTLFPGAPSRELCISASTTKAVLDRMFDDNVLIQKLVALPALKLPRERVAMQSAGRRLQEALKQQQRQRYLFELFKAEGPQRSHSARGAGQLQTAEQGLRGAERRLSQYGRRLSGYRRL